MEPIPAAKRAGAPADTSALKAEIDRHAYALHSPSLDALRWTGALASEKIKLVKASATHGIRLEILCRKELEAIRARQNKQK